MLMLAITGRRRSASARDQGFYASADVGAQRELARRGVLRAVFRRLDGRGHVFLLETETVAIAQRLLETYPSVATEVSRFHLVAIEASVIGSNTEGEGENTARPARHKNGSGG